MQVELRFHALRLKNLDMMSKSDPCVMVYSKPVDGPLSLVGHTETVRNNRLAD
jgi:hypothetical protein